MAIAIGVVVVLAFFLLIILGSAIRILREYERGVIFRLGRLIAQKGPGLILLIPFIDRMVRVDLRTVTLDVAAAGGDHPRQRARRGSTRSSTSG